MRRWIPLLLVLGACTSGAEPGDTDVWWKDQGTGFEYDDCYDSPLVGEWAAASKPDETVIIFEADCVFTHTTGEVCQGPALFDYVTAASGTVTIRQNGTACATCTYTVGPSGDELTLDCGVSGVPTSFVSR